MAPDSAGDGKHLAEPTNVEMDSEKLVEFLNELGDLLRQREHTLLRPRHPGHQL